MSSFSWWGIIIGGALMLSRFADNDVDNSFIRLWGTRILIISLIISNVRYIYDGVHSYIIGFTLVTVLLIAYETKLYNTFSKLLFEESADNEKKS